jgi:hypothetical protein
MVHSLVPNKQKASKLRRALADEQQKYFFKCNAGKHLLLKTPNKNTYNRIYNRIL